MPVVIGDHDMDVAAPSCVTTLPMSLSDAVGNSPGTLSNEESSESCLPCPVPGPNQRRNTAAGADGRGSQGSNAC